MDNNDASPLDTLRQLKEWLDAGTITPQEFETLKRKLLFSENPPAAPSTPEATPALTPAVPVAPPVVPPSPAFNPTPSAPVPPPTANVPPPVERHVTPPPVDDPLLPPVITNEPAARVEPVVLKEDYFRREPVAVPPSAAVPPTDDTLDEPSDEPRRQPLATVLIIVGVVALLGIIGYLLLGNRESERLTSNSITAADTTSVQIEEGPQAEQLDLPPAAAPETIRVQPNIPVAAQTADSAATGTGAAPAGTAPADPAVSEATIRSRVQRALTALYNDMEAAPFNASQHFAPQVERFYTLQNTTPGAIEAELNRSHFPEFTESQISFDPSSLQISPVTDDGSVTVTYNERGRSLRKSRNQYQQTLAQVRARIDRTGKLTYFRQERLLENTFTDAAPASAPIEPTPPQE
ncbi:SHOCT domain-containing protein [Hymenobacter latericus]|uniref:SHOCT domain-containing protein n=1 Tax=Hymenobacter sp. YIM 151858-1 TaxID=2987688 RepID=UPI002226B9BF|nr:SHOCT domain-containing protein [Hymenobacter sp. YIM 151858-1]UYZ58984.1 SHOCT domain-containing protein [Hymenobacter sp. YIM 151858-1]